MRKLQTSRQFFIVLSLLFYSQFSFTSEPAVTTVSSVTELRSAFASLAKTKEEAIIVVQPGLYSLSSQRLIFPRANIRLIGATGDPEDVIFDGGGMQTGVGFIFDVSHDHISISGVTLRNVRHHLIQVRAENGASDFTLTNCILQDAYEQLLKVSASHEENAPYSDRGKISGCTFEYTKGIAPQYYVGGVNAHRSRDWIVENNVFKNIASPEDRVAQPAIHFWRNSKNTIVRNNTIINSDRSIGFGLGNLTNDHIGGEITQNAIIHHGLEHHINADVGIFLESAKSAVISDNFIYSISNYPNAIEYRFNGSFDNVIKDNVANKRIRSRDNGQAALENNQVKSSMTVDIQYLFEKLIN